MNAPIIPLVAGLFNIACKSSFNLMLVLKVPFFWRNKGPKIQAKRVVPKSNPIVKLIVLVGRSAIAIGIPRNEVFPIKPDNCRE